MWKESPIFGDKLPFAIGLEVETIDSLFRLDIRKKVFFYKEGGEALE